MFYLYNAVACNFPRNVSILGTYRARPPSLRVDMFLTFSLAPSFACPVCLSFCPAARLHRWLADDNNGGITVRAANGVATATTSVTAVGIVFVVGTVVDAIN